MKASITFSDLSPADLHQLMQMVGNLNNSNGASTAITTGTIPHGAGAGTGSVMTAQPSNDEHDDTGPANINAPAADSAGIPWDGRIHSDNKKQNADGTWRKRRGVDANMVAAVEAELKLRGSQQGGLYMQQPQSAPQATAPTGNVPMPNLTGYQQAPMTMPPGYSQPGSYPGAPGPAPQYTPPPSYTPPHVQQQPQSVQRVDFSTFMQHISSKFNERDAQGAPVIHADVLHGICGQLSAAFGRPVNAITDIAADQNMINAAQDALITQNRW